MSRQKSRTLDRCCRPRHSTSPSSVTALLILVAALIGCGGESTRPTPVLYFTPDTLDFGHVAMGTPRQLDLRIENHRDDLSFRWVKVTPDDFSLAGGEDSLLVITPTGEEDTVSIVFDPVQLGSRSGSVLLSGSPLLRVPCVGFGESDECGLEPPELDFGAKHVGTTTQGTIIVRNRGTLLLSGDVSSSCPEFEVVEGSGPFQLNLGDTLTVVVEFRPQSLGIKECWIDMGGGACPQVLCKGVGNRTWYVSADGTGEAPTIQAAIDSASDGDVVLVGTGTYYESINMRGKAIHLRSEHGPESTIIDGSRDSSSVITCDSGETEDTIIEGLTITGGIGTRWHEGSIGGGILCSGAGATIVNNVIRGNRTWVEPGGFNKPGGGLCIWSGQRRTRIEGNIISDNVSPSNGGGLNLSGEDIVVRNNIIEHNRSSEGGDGGGIRVFWSYGRILIYDNLIRDNFAYDHGGGLYISGRDGGFVEVAHNVIVGNEALGGKGAADCSGGGIWASRNGFSIHHNTIAFNTAEQSRGNVIGAGGICIIEPYDVYAVENNIVAFNEAGALVVSAWAAAHLWQDVLAKQNLVFGNGDPQFLVDFPVGVPDGYSKLKLIQVDNVIEDPLFCVDGPETRGEVAFESPALSQPFGVIGAVTEPTCNRSQAPTAWDGVRTLYR